MPLCLVSLRVRACHALWEDFPEPSTHDTSSNIAVLLPPRGRNPAGLGCSPFARHYWGNHCCFPFLRVLRCFSSPGLPLISRCRAVSPAGCPIRRSADHRSFAPSRGLSQLVTSFIACKSQGIRHTPLPTFFARTCLPLEGRGRRRGETAPHQRPAEDRRFVYFQLSL